MTTEPTKEELLAALEALSNAVETSSGLPDDIYDQHMGVLTRTPRQEYICPGYSRRNEADSLGIARMIFTLVFKCTIPYGEDHWCTHVQEAIDKSLVTRAKELMSTWYKFHPQA